MAGNLTLVVDRGEVVPVLTIHDTLQPAARPATDRPAPIDMFTGKVVVPIEFDTGLPEAF